MGMEGISETDGGITLNIRVVPRASRSEIVGFHDGALKVRIAAPPVDGAANEELVKVLAKAVGLSRSSVEIVGGLASKNKRVALRGVSLEDLERILKGK